MNDNQCLGLRIRFDGGGSTNSAWQSIRGAPNKMVEDARKAIGNKFVGLRIRFDDEGCTNSAWKSICGAPDSVVEDT